MNVLNRNINKIFFIFILLHLVIWTFVPSLTNSNLPLDKKMHLRYFVEKIDNVGLEISDIPIKIIKIQKKLLLKMEKI